VVRLKSISTGSTGPAFLFEQSDVQFYPDGVSGRAAKLRGLGMRG
jgi:hypothetical protein